MKIKTAADYSVAVYLYDYYMAHMRLFALFRAYLGLLYKSSSKSKTS